MDDTRALIIFEHPATGKSTCFSSFSTSDTDLFICILPCPGVPRLIFARAIPCCTNCFSFGHWIVTAIVSFDTFSSSPTFARIFYLHRFISLAVILLRSHHAFESP
jgi:hypothetical protein